MYARLGRRVWRCRSAHPLREAAVRLIYAPKGPALHARIEALQRAHHTGLASIVEVSALDEHTLIAMTLATGRSLDDLGPREPREIYSIARQLADSLAHLHAFGVYHGALRLGHVRRASDERWMLIDPWLPQPSTPRLSGASIAQEPSIEEDVSALAAMLFALYTGRTTSGRTPQRGLDTGSAAPPPVRDWILRATSRQTATVSMLRERLIALEGTVAVSLPRSSPPRGFDKAAPAPAPPEKRAIETLRPPKPVDPSLYEPPPADDIPWDLVGLGLIGVTATILLPVAFALLLLLSSLV